jgi:hypothetical protein
VRFNQEHGLHITHRLIDSFACMPIWLKYCHMMQALLDHSWMRWVRVLEYDGNLGE